MPKFMCVKDANGSQLREIWKTTAILSTELLKNHTTENHRCLWDNPAQLSTYIMDPELIWALCDDMDFSLSKDTGKLFLAISGAPHSKGGIF